MTKDEFKQKLDEAGDAVITYRSKNSRRLKYNICTRDFSTPYIKEKKNRAKDEMVSASILKLRNKRKNIKRCNG